MVWSTRSIAKISLRSQQIQPGDPPKENGSYWQREKESTIRLEKAKFSAKQWVEDDKSEKAESQPETRTSCRFGIVTQDWRCCETKAACGCSKRWKPLFVDICSCVNGNLISVTFIDFMCYCRYIIDITNLLGQIHTYVMKFLDLVKREVWGGDRENWKRWPTSILRWWTCTVAPSSISIELWCRLPWGLPWFQPAVRADPWISTEWFSRRWRNMVAVLGGGGWCVGEEKCLRDDGGQAVHLSC